MKCLKITGTDSLADEFIFNFSRTMRRKIICVVSENEGGGVNVSFPGASSALKIMRSFPPDIVLLRSQRLITAPVVHCGSDIPEDSSLLLKHCSGGDSDVDYEDIYRRTINFLPQKTAEECGRCGLDCRRFAEAVLRGKRKEDDCFYAPGNVEVKLGGRSVELGRFPAGMIEGAVRGMLSSLKGYNKEKSVSITIRH